MRRWLFLLLLTVSAVAQRPVSIRIESLVADDSAPMHRTFTLEYSLTNLTDKPIRFILNTEGVVPQISSSLSVYPHYTLLQNGKSVDVSGIFTWRETSGTKRYTEAEYRHYLDSLSKTDPEKLKLESQQRLASNLVELAPNEKKTFTIIMGWDRERYQKQDENEYFLDASATYELEMSMHLLRDEIKDKFAPEFYEKLLKDPDFITGWFTSNKVVIDLADRKEK